MNNNFETQVDHKQKYSQNVDIVKSYEYVQHSNLIAYNPSESTFKIISHMPLFQNGELVITDLEQFKISISLSYNSLSREEKYELSDIYTLILLCLEGVKLVSVEGTNSESILKSIDESKKIDLYTIIKIVNDFSSFIINNSESQTFTNKINNRLTDINEYLVKVYSNLNKEIQPLGNSKVLFVKEITRDPEGELSTAYESLSASGISAGKDELTGLYLQAIKYPGYIDENNIDEKVAKVVHTYVHECIHSIEPPMLSEEEIEPFLLELLTDSLTNILMNIKENVNLVSLEKDKVSESYFRVTTLAQELINLQIVSENDVISFAVRQDPKGFLELLDSKLKNLFLENPNIYLELLKILLNLRMILPLLEDELELNHIKMKDDFSTFLKNKVKESMNLIGGDIFSIVQVNFMSLNYDFVKTFPYERDEQNYYRSIYNPDGSLKDSAIKMFREKNNLPASYQQ